MTTQPNPSGAAYPRQTDQTDPAPAPIRCIEAEAGLLGAALLAPHNAGRLLDGLTDDDFTEPPHAAVYGVLQGLLDQRRHPEPITVLAALRRTGQRLDRDPAVLLHDLMQAVLTPGCGPSYRATVREHTRRRTITEAAARLDQAARTADADTLREVLSYVVDQLSPDQPRIRRAA